MSLHPVKTFTFREPKCHGIKKRRWRNPIIRPGEESKLPLHFNKVHFKKAGMIYSLKRRKKLKKRVYNVRIDGCPRHTWRKKTTASSFWNIHNRLPKTITAQSRVRNDFPSLNSCNKVISDEISFKPSRSEYWCCIKGQSCHVDTDLSDVLVDN